MSPETHILEAKGIKPDPIDAILAQRGNRYGEFKEHARITQAMKDAMKTESMGNYCSLPDYMKEALEMVCHKIGRIVNGDPYYDDSWIDIIGYTQLVLDELNKKEQNGN